MTQTAAATHHVIAIGQAPEAAAVGQPGCQPVLKMPAAATMPIGSSVQITAQLAANSPPLTNVQVSFTIAGPAGGTVASFDLCSGNGPVAMAWPAVVGLGGAVSWFWFKSGQYVVTATLTGTCGNGLPASATGTWTVTVVGPTVQAAIAEDPIKTLDADSGKVTLIKFGVGPINLTPTSGVRMSVVLTPQGPATAGQVIPVQVVDTLRTHHLTNGKVATLATHGFWLDNVCPYLAATRWDGSNKAALVTDAPQDAVITNGEDAMTSSVIQDRFKMYFLFKPDGDPSIPAPLGFFTWQWSTTATYDDDEDELVITGTGATDSGFLLSSEAPAWQHVMTTNVWPKWVVAPAAQLLGEVGPTEQLDRQGRLLTLRATIEDDALFDYSATPARVPCGGQGGAESVTLTVQVANETGDVVDCSKIAIELPHDPQTGYLTDDPAAISLDVLPPSSWQLTPGDDEWTFVAEPVGAATGLGIGEVLGLVLGGMTPDAAPGSVDLRVTETTDRDRGATIGVTKVAPQVGITELTADSLFVAPGTPVTVSWSAFDATGCTLSWNGSRYRGKAQDSHLVELPETTTFTLTAEGSGAPVEEELTVTVARPQVLSFGADPDTVGQGGPSLLSWETVYAQTVKLDWDGLPQPIVVPERSDGYPVYPETTTHYNLEAIGVGGTDPSQQLVSVAPVVVESFAATPPVGVPGDPVTLSWSTQYASGCSIDPGVGSVATNGSVVVHPGADMSFTTYTLTATGLQPESRSVDVYSAAALTMLTCDQYGQVYFQTEGWWTVFDQSGNQIAIGQGDAPLPLALGQGAGKLVLQTAYGVATTVTFDCDTGDDLTPLLALTAARGLNSTDTISVETILPGTPGATSAVTTAAGAWPILAGQNQASLSGPLTGIDLEWSDGGGSPRHVRMAVEAPEPPTR